MTKKLIPLSALLLAGGLFLNSCSKDGMSPTGVRQMPMTTTTANPAWTYVSSTTINNQVRYTIDVSNSDGTHEAILFTSASISDGTGSPTWSPS